LIAVIFGFTTTSQVIGYEDRVLHQSSDWLGGRVVWWDRLL